MNEYNDENSRNKEERVTNELSTEAEASQQSLSDQQTSVTSPRCPRSTAAERQASILADSNPLKAFGVRVVCCSERGAGRRTADSCQI